VIERFRHFQTIVVPGKLDNLDMDLESRDIVRMSQLETWPTEAEAAAQLATSVKTIARLAAKGKIEVRKRPRAGKKPENVCNPDDVQKLMPAPRVMPPDELEELETQEWLNAPMGKPATASLVPANAAAVFTLIGTIAKAMETQREIVRTPKLWLTLDEAADFSGLPRSAVADFAAEGRITAMKRGAWFVNRASLEAFAG
jgi:hypothetical protein